MNNRGLLGQYAGFTSRAVAFSIDILVITVLVLLIYWMLRLPLTFVLGVNLSKCMAEQVQVGITSGPLLCRSARGSGFWLRCSRRRPILFSSIRRPARRWANLSSVCASCGWMGNG